MRPEGMFRQEVVHAAEQMRSLLDQQAPLLALASDIRRVLRSGGQILVFGNGGSAAQAQHCATELVGRFERTRAGLPATALTCDGAVLTALANDFGFSEIFARQLRALARPGDLVLGLTTSGRSENVLRGLEAAGNIGCRTAALTGAAGLARPSKARVVAVGAERTARVQELHLVCIHLLCGRVEAPWPVIFLDRDGTLIRDTGYIGDPERVELLDGVPAALRGLRERGFELVVVSNQSGIGRGLLSAEQVAAVDARMQALLREHDVHLDASLFCPHAPAARCGCRKPEPGLIEQWLDGSGGLRELSWMVGDKPSDVEAGRRAGLKTAKLGEAEPRADLSISQLTELLAHV